MKPEIDYMVKRTNGKYIRIRVRVDGAVIVTAPSMVSEQQIQSFVKEKEAWILECKQQILHKDKEQDRLLYLGNKIAVQPGDYVDIFYKNQLLYVPHYEKEADIRDNLRIWFANQTRSIIEEHIYRYSDYLGVTINRITIRNQRTRWGSCSSLGNLNFNWRLSMAPMEVIVYIIVHEVCHLVYMNHSTEFWQLVESLLPEYRHAKQWLAANGSKMFRMIETLSFHTL